MVRLGPFWRTKSKNKSAEVGEAVETQLEVVDATNKGPRAWELPDELLEQIFTFLLEYQPRHRNLSVDASFEPDANLPFHRAIQDVYGNAQSRPPCEDYEHVTLFATNIGLDFARLSRLVAHVRMHTLSRHRNFQC